MSQVNPNPFEPPQAAWPRDEAAGPGGIRFLESYGYIFRSPDWMLTILFTGICQLIPIIGPMVLMGYQFQIVEALTRNPNAVYPSFSFDFFVDYLKRGLWPFLVSLVVSLALVVPIWLVVYGLLVVVFLAAASVEGEAGAVLAVLGLVVVGSAVIVLSVGLWLVLMPMILRSGLAQDFAEAFRFDFVKSFVGKTWKEMLLCALFLTVSGWLFASAGMLLFCVGVYFAVAVISLAQAHLFYQLYQVFLSRGGKPIPLKPTAPGFSDGDSKIR